MNRKKFLLGIALGYFAGWSSPVQAADHMVDGGTDGNSYISPLSTMQTSQTFGSSIGPSGWNRGVIGNDRIVYGNNITVTTSGTSPLAAVFLSGVYFENDLDIQVGNRLSITTTADNADADGIRSNPSNNAASATVTIGDHLSVRTQGISADGVNLTGTSKAVIGNDATIVTAYAGATPFGKEGAHGLRTNHNSSITVGDDLSVTTYSTGSALGSGGHGIYVAPYSFTAALPYTVGSSITVGDNAKITTYGNYAQGVANAARTGYVTIGKDSTITTSGSSSMGIASAGTTILGGGAVINATNSVGVLANNLTTALPVGYSGDVAYIEIQGGGSRRSSVTSGGSATYTVGANAGGKIAGTDVDITATGATMNGIRIMGSAANTRSSSIDLTNSTISSNGDSVRMEGTGTSYGSANQLVFSLNQGTISSTTGKGINLIGGQGQVTLDRATIYSFESALQLDTKANGNQLDVNARNGSQILNDVTVLGIDDTKVGTLNLNLESGSYWKGAANGATVSLTTGNSEFLNVGLKDSRWDVTAASNVTQLNLLGNSVISLSADDAVTPGSFVTLTVRDLDNHGSSNNKFYMNTDLAQMRGSLLTVTGNSAGDYGLYIQNQGSASIDPSQELKVVDTVDGIATFSLDHEVEVGGYEYYLKRADGDASNWNLYATKKYTPPAAASLNAFAGLYLLNYVETQTLIQRLGDLRQAESNGNVWARAFGGEFESASNSFLSGFDMTYSGFQAGIDSKFTMNNNKDTVYIGAMAGYAKGNQDYYNAGGGTIDSKIIGLYGTYIGSKGFYVDLVGKYGWMTNDYKVLDTAGTLVVADKMQTDGFSASLEVGQRYHFDRKVKQGWYVEPQAQISYGHQSGGTFSATNGLVVDVDSFDSVLGRAGMLVGYEAKGGKNPINVYGKLSYVHEFNGDVGATMNGITAQESFGDSWLVYGVGITAQLGKKHNLYLDIERATGGQFDQPWAINGGYRFSW